MPSSIKYGVWGGKSLTTEANMWLHYELFSNSIPLYYSCLLLLSAFIASQVPNKSLIYSNYSNLGENNFPKFPTKGLENVVDLKIGN